MIDDQSLAALAEACRLLYATGLTHAAGGNASIRRGDSVWITPTGMTLRDLQPADMVRVGLDGQRWSEAQPSKELDLHLAIYRACPAAKAVLHPHPPHAIAYGMRCPGARLDALPASNAGFYYRAGQVPQLPYLRSGSAELRDTVGELARGFAAILLGNHGLICGGTTLDDALNICEEIEQNCRILLLAGDGARVLSLEQRAEIDSARGRAWLALQDLGRAARTYFGDTAAS